MSFTNAFEKIAILPVGAGMDDLYDDGARKYYQVSHSPILHGAASAAKYGLPAAARAALVSPKGFKGKNAAILGGLIGAVAGVSTAADKKYKNMLEKAHLQYHLGD